MRVRVPVASAAGLLCGILCGYAWTATTAPAPEVRFRPAVSPGTTDDRVVRRYFFDGTQEVERAPVPFQSGPTQPEGIEPSSGSAHWPAPDERYSREAVFRAVARAERLCHRSADVQLFTDCSRYPCVVVALGAGRDRVEPFCEQAEGPPKAPNQNVDGIWEAGRDGRAVFHIVADEWQMTDAGLRADAIARAQGLVKSSFGE
jgi:hypothetical protein